MKYYQKIISLFFTAIILTSTNGYSGERKFEIINQFDVPEARQGVAVDDSFFYAINTRQIAKYNRVTGEFIKQWQEQENGPIIHLDSGAVINGKLYCAHSNYPGIPMTSSIEVWDPETLEHIESHSFGIQWGSCTWVDWHDGFWWASFAQYDKWKTETLKGTEWTTVVKFDKNWNKLEAWLFTPDIVERFKPMSNSGGSWGPDGYLYCTGHDHPELYVLKLPEKGSFLELVDTVPLQCLGQGIAWDRSNKNTIFSIHKKNRQVIISKFINK